ncbi:response regulator [Pontiellaceae bacterium B1224]|nr:response regulator [Pontiellaceae bacterium B1224]
MEKQRILFVDDEPSILMGLQRLLRSHRNEWDIHFANSGAEALQKMDADTFDIIVTDLRMPGMTGVELLQQVKERHPGVGRFILSGHGDTDMLIKSVTVAHQFLAKPCDADYLKESIARAVQLRNLFNSDILAGIVKDGSTLPTLPELYQELTEVLSSPDSNADKISAVLEKDVPSTAKILQLVNSAFFGLSRQIDNISQAVGLLGAETINSIALTTQVFGKFGEYEIGTFSIREIYSHSLAVGAAAGKLMKVMTNDRKQADEAMLAGLVHDLGKLILIASDNEDWRTLYSHRHDSDIPFYQREKDLLGVNHAEVGAYLLGIWGLSNKIVEAVAYHTDPSSAPQSNHFTSLTALYLANVFDIERRGGGDYGKVKLDEEYLSSCGVADRIEELRQISFVEDDGVELP